MAPYMSSIYKFKQRNFYTWEKIISKYYYPSLWEKVVFHPIERQYILDTGNFCNAHVHKELFPSVRLHPFPTKNVSCYEYTSHSTIDNIESVIKKRHAYKDNISVEPKKFDQKVNTFEVLSQLKETKYITHWVYSPIKNEVLIFIHDYLPILITSETCRDAKLPFFDLDFGFVNDGSSDIFPEWEEDFKEWKKKFQCDPEKHWDDEIIKVNLPR